MALTTEKKAQLQTELDALNKAIVSAINSQSYATSGGNSVTRQDIKYMQKRRTQIEKMLGLVKTSRAKEIV